MYYYMFQTFTRVWDSLSNITNNAIIGNLLILAGSFFSSFFLPIVPLVMLCVGATIVDMYYGIKVSEKHNVKPQSRFMWTGTLRKLKDTFVILALAHGVELYILKNITDLPVLTGSSALIVTLTEMWSILENMNTLNPKGPWRVLKKFLKLKGSRYLDVDLEKIEEEIKNDDNKKNNNSGTKNTGDTGLL